ncbi:heavy metal translocating P-type ATPase [Egibacter rhizosphaerae]|uniref:Heavy metal translocating P-type ATPase n=2 Tax=Egibacter rhizosphaerae TaxID=1670831 RepID=A0A411YLD8_9ACTN|nr:heavy metal translocating P-type ATPase [Egibacter rhizosphaerae]
MFRERFWVSLVLTVPVVVYAEAIQDWFGYTAPTFPGSAWLAPVLGTAVFLYGGWPFLTGGWSELKARQPGMMLLVAMAVTVAFGSSVATTLGLVNLVDFWWEMALLVSVMLLGHWLEMRALGQARGALAALAELLPDTAERVTDHGSTESVPVGDLTIGDVVLVRPGSRVPADGEIASGRVEVDESMITGESNPVARSEGDRVVAGTVATDSSVRVRVDAVGEDTTLAGIQRMVEDAQRSSTRVQALADRAAALLFYVALGAGLITLIVWLGLGDVDMAMARTITVLVIACPHALGLAIPLVTSISTSLSARNGILVKDRLALEQMRTIDTVLFDKTGTLTLGEHAVVEVAVTSGADADRTLALAAATEGDSEHPLARAIVAHAHQHGLDVPSASDFRALSGRGVTASVDTHEVAVGGPALLRERGLEVPGDLDDRIESWQARGAAVLHVVVDDAVTAVLAMEDQVRPESREAVRALREAGVRVAMVTGDARQVADAVAADLGIDEVFAEVLPEDKDKKATELQQRGEAVAMVGDGVNDAPALARADVGIAIGAGTDVAIESAGIVLASDDPQGVVSVRTLSRRTYGKMIQNLVWAAGYNAAAIPLAAGVLAWAGFVLPMSVGAALMSLSTIIVALNAQLLRRAESEIAIPA